MPTRSTVFRFLASGLSLGITIAVLCFPLCAQKPIPKAGSSRPTLQSDSSGADLEVAVRDAHGAPLGIPAVVRVYSMTASFDVTIPTRDASTAHFTNVLPGDYEVDVTCPGYRKATQHVSFRGHGVRFSAVVNVVPETNAEPSSGRFGGVVMTPQLRSQVQKGLEALGKRQYEEARKILTKAVQKAPGNPDIVCFLGLAELGLRHPDLAREDFEHALSLDPNHELALVTLGELQMKSGTPSAAITSLEKAVALGHAGWRTRFDLACAYAKVNRLSEAEAEAARAVQLAKEKNATPTFLLGEIQYAEGHFAEAKQTWQSVLSTFPTDPIVAATKKMLTRLEEESLQAASHQSQILSLPPVPDIGLQNLPERPWAPPDIDNEASAVTSDANCGTERILDGAFGRMKSELSDLEKFAATEHIEHQEIDRNGWPGPVQARDFSYIVFVYPRGRDSFYLEESRTGGDDLSRFPTSLATTGLNSLGVSILQPTFRGIFNYSCEGETDLRGHTVWQIRFEQKLDVKGGGFRKWQRNGVTYDLPIKGRIWISAGNYAVMRIATDLRNPVPQLELTRDHLVVDYGPVKFLSSQVQLWLPWSAEMYMELKGKRYHHRHFLSDYLLFDVGTTHTASRPKEQPLQLLE